MRRFGSARLRESDSLLLAIGTASLAIAPGIAGVMAARSLGPEGRGQLAVAVALATIGGTVGMRGLDMAILADSGESDLDLKRSLLLRRAKNVIVVDGLIAGLATAVVLWTARPPIVLSVIALAAATVVFLLTRAVNLGAGRTPRVLSTDLVSSAVMLVGAAVVTLAGGDAAGYVFASAGGLLVGGWYGLRGIPATSDRDAAARSLADRLGGIGSTAWKARILQSAAFRLDRVVLAATAGTAAAGVYAAVVPIAEMATIVPLHLAQLTTARIARAETPSGWHEERSSQLALLISVVGIALILALAGPVVDLLYGPEFESGVVALRLLAVASLVSVLWRLNEAELFGRGRTDGIVAATAVAAVIVLGGTAVLSSFDASAPAIASLVGYSAACALTFRFVLRARRA